MTENAPPEKGKGSDSHHTVEALETKHRPRQRSASPGISGTAELVNISGRVDAEICGGPQ